MSAITRSTFLSIVVVILLLVNSATIIFILFRKPEHPRHLTEKPHDIRPPFKGALLPEQLGFTGEQTRRFETLREEHFAINNKLRTSMRETRELLFNCIATKDTANARYFTKQMGGISMMLESNNFRHFSAVRDICTKAQLPLYYNLLKDISRSIGAPTPPPQGADGFRPQQGEGPPPM
jgi:periplasmic protein CpxP/Spy